MLKKSTLIVLSIFLSSCAGDPLPSTTKENCASQAIRSKVQNNYAHDEVVKWGEECAKKYYPNLLNENGKLD